MKGVGARFRRFTGVRVASEEEVIACEHAVRRMGSFTPRA